MDPWERFLLFALRKELILGFSNPDSMQPDEVFIFNLIWAT